MAVGHARTVELIALDQALDRLAALSPRQAEIVQLRYFAGLNVEEMADVLGVSPSTVSRDRKRRRPGSDMCCPSRRRRKARRSRLRRDEAMPSPEDRWRRLEALFVTACELPLDERSTFVESETAGDPDLRRELGRHARPRLGRRRADRPRDRRERRDVPAPAPVGRHVGPYASSARSDGGGMGLVFEAVRDDDEVSQDRGAQDRAAVDRCRVGPRAIPSRAPDSRGARASEHARVSSTAAQRTECRSFVMEYIDGLPITEFCDRRGLDIRAQLALVRQVCAAVHFAHESFVVHRDLKPSNILVSDDGIPKLLDFGIAKLLDPGDGGATATVEARWTPNYTSPEQVRGRAVTTHADVYSLGLVLYELLTGSSPAGGRLHVCGDAGAVDLRDRAGAPERARAAGRFGRSSGQSTAWRSRHHRDDGDPQRAGAPLRHRGRARRRSRPLPRWPADSRSTEHAHLPRRKNSCAVID